MATAVSTSKNPNLTLQNIVQWTLISAFAAAIVNAIVFLVVGGVFENVLAQGDTISLAVVAGFTFMLILVGGVVLYGMSRFLNNALTYWIYLGIGFTVLYGVMPFAALTSTVEEGGIMGAAFALNLFHAIAAGITLYLFGTQLKAD